MAHRSLKVESSVLNSGCDPGSSGIGDGVSHLVFMLPKFFSSVCVEAEDAFFSRPGSAALADAIELAFGDEKIGQVDFPVCHRWSGVAPIDRRAPSDFKCIIKTLSNAFFPPDSIAPGAQPLRPIVRMQVGASKEDQYESFFHTTEIPKSSGDVNIAMSWRILTMEQKQRFTLSIDGLGGLRDLTTTQSQFDPEFQPPRTPNKTDSRDNAGCFTPDH